MEKTSITYKILECYLKTANRKKQHTMPEEKLIEHIKTKHRAYDLPKFLYKKFDVTKSVFKERPVFLIKPKNGLTEKVILFLHGGGGISCPAILHYRMAADLVRGTGAALYFPFYPLGPEASAGQSMLWLKDFYEELTEKYKPSDITFVGDSAGAALCAGLCERVNSKPSRMVLISPASGLDKPRDEKMKQAEKNDLMLSFELMDMIEKYWCTDVSFSSSAINPSNVDYTGFPPIMLYYGTNELFCIYMNELIEKIKNSGTYLEVHTGKGLCHDWAIADIIPEGRKAIKEMCDFVKRS